MAKWQKPIKGLCSVTHNLKGTNVAVVRMLKCPAEMQSCYITVNGKPLVDSEVNEGKDFYTVKAAKACAEKIA